MTLAERTDGTPNTLTVDVTALSVSEADGAAATTITVTRDFDLDIDLTVDLASDDSSEATVPDTVTILAGQTSAVVDLDAVNDAIVDGTQTATITATVQGVALDSTFGTDGFAPAPLHDIWGATTPQADGRSCPSPRVSPMARSPSPATTPTGHSMLPSARAGLLRWSSPRLPRRMFPERVLIQPDGKIVIGGRTSFPLGAFLLRLNADGTADSTYGNGGIADLSGISTDYRINDLDLTPDGKVLAAVARSTKQIFRVLRVNANGTVDTSFGTRRNPCRHRRHHRCGCD